MMEIWRLNSILFFLCQASWKKLTKLLLCFEASTKWYEKRSTKRDGC